MSQDSFEFQGGNVVALPLKGACLYVDAGELGSGQGGGGAEIVDYREGVEIVLPKRFKGKQLYGQYVDFGTLPNAKDKFILHGIPNIEWVVADTTMSYVYVSSNTAALSYPVNHPNTGNGYWLYHVNNSQILMRTALDRTTHKAKFFLIYTKITDQPVNP